MGVLMEKYFDYRKKLRLGDILIEQEVITEEQAMILKGLAMREDPITEYDVRKALWTDQGVYRA